MRLKHDVDDRGVLWFENPVVTVRARFVRGIGYLGAAAAATSAAVLLTQPAAVPLPALQVLLALAVVCILWWAIRRLRPMHALGAPRRIGFSSLELHLPDDRGNVDRIRWSDVESSALSRDDKLSGMLTLRGRGMTRSIRGLNLDVALKIRWAHALASRGSFDAQLLTGPPPTFDVTERPLDGTLVPGATPEVRLYSDRMLVWKAGRGVSVPKEDVDALWFPLLGKDRLIISGRGHQLAVILEPNASPPFLTWLYGEPGGESGASS